MSFPFAAVLTEAAVLATSTTADGHRVGEVGYTEDGRRFRYCKAGAALGGVARMVGNGSYAPGVTGHEDEDGYEGDFYEAAVAGAHKVKIEDTGSRAEDYYAGGYLAVFHTANFLCYYILSSERNSDAGDAGYGAYVEVTLVSGLTTAVTGSTACTAYINPYGDCQPYGTYEQTRVTFVALPLVAVASGSYFWGQVGGPAWVTPHGDTWPGAAANYRDVYAHIDGTIDPASVHDPTSGVQRVGTLLSMTSASYGDGFIMLQLDGG